MDPIGLVGTLGSAVISNLFANKNKVSGVPTPTTAQSWEVPEGSGARSGKEQLGYMDAAFPGTTPWERLGVGSSFAPSATAELGARRDTELAESRYNFERSMKIAELKQSRDIAEKNNIASIIGATSPMGAVVRDQGLKAYLTKGLSTMFGDRYKGGAEKSEADIKRTTVETQARSPFGKLGDTIAKGFDVIGSGVGNVARGAGKAYGSAENVLDDLFKLIDNRGKAPSRFAKNG